jgi:hypothetical protein
MAPPATGPAFAEISKNHIDKGPSPMMSRTSRFATLFAGLFLAFSMVAIDHA